MAKLEYLITVIVPVYNQAQMLPSFTRELVSMLDEHFLNFEVLIMDNGSTDETPDIIERILSEVKCVRYVRLGRHVSKESAIGISLNTAIGEYVVTMSPASDPIAMIPMLVEKATKSRHGVVLAIQRHSSDSLFMRLLKNAFHWYCRRFLGLRFPKNFGMFMALNRQIVNNLIKGRGNDRFVRALGLDRDEVVYDPKPHTRDAEYSLIRKIEGAADTLESNSTHPLFIVTILGFLACVANLFYALYVLFVALTGDNLAHGWPTTSLQISVMFFFLFLLMMILSEYLGKVFNELIGKEYNTIVQEKSSYVLLANADRENVVS